MFAGGAKGPLPFCGLKKESNVQEKLLAEKFLPLALLGKQKRGEFLPKSPLQILGEGYIITLK